MALLADLTRIRDLLDRDRIWSAYAIGDLAPEQAAHCSWHASGDGTPALVLVYRGFDPPVLFAQGDPPALETLFAQIDAPRVSLHVRREALTALSRTYRIVEIRPLWRMAVEPAAFRPADTAGVVSLRRSDLPAITALYDDGRAHGEWPAFFFPSMLDQGTFRGIWEGGELVAAAGTHLFSPRLGVCTIGNVYTRRDRRGRGLAARVTSAVVDHALSHEVPTIVLNVGQENSRARRVYARLGFRRHCEFFEGEAIVSDEPR